MNKPPIPEEAFRLGAEAMRSRIVAVVMMKGHTKLAVDILSTEAPAFSLPEKMVLATASNCKHRWVDARNEVVTSGELCVLCGEMRSNAEVSGLSTRPPGYRAGTKLGEK